MRQDDSDAWPMRAWVMAALCAFAGLVFNGLLSSFSTRDAQPGHAAGATFIAIAALSFVLTVERRRWIWSVVFALGWGVVVALVGWFTARYNQRPTIFEYPFFSGVFAVLLAAPLFQTIRDEGAWRFPYDRLHRHAWIDAVIGLSALLFTGVSYLLAWLIAGLFMLIGVTTFRELLTTAGFSWALSGFAFGGAVGLLRERDGLVATLHRLVTVVLSVLAPVLAVALILFLALLPFTGLHELWASRTPETVLMLLAAMGAILLTNAVVGDGEERPGGPGDSNAAAADSPGRRVLWLSALGLTLTLLPLAVIAAFSIGKRIEQYGWTPDRIWAVTAVVVATGYGIAGWYAVARGRLRFDRPLRPLQTALALGLCGLALFLALPILDFGAISARSQTAMLRAGDVTAEKFDWQAMAFDFGPAGREALSRIVQRGPAEQRRLAAAALEAKYRHGNYREPVETPEQLDEIARSLRIVPQGGLVPAELRDRALHNRLCRFGPCVLTMAGADSAVLVGRSSKEGSVQSQIYTRTDDGHWPQYSVARQRGAGPPRTTDLAAARVELRNVTRRQLFVDGEPTGEVFD